MKIYLKKISEITNNSLSIEDKIHFGDKIISEKRNFYNINNPIFYNKNLYIYSKQSRLISRFFLINLFSSKISLLNINCPFPLRRSQKEKFNLTDVLNFNNLKKYTLKNPGYLFVPNKPNSNNYWHSLIDNYSDLINVQKYYKNLDVLCNLNQLSKQNYSYLFFLKEIFNFEVINIGDQNLDFKGKIIVIDTGVEHNLGLENNKKISLKINKKAEEEAKEIFGAYKIKRIYKFGIVPHSYKLFYEREERVVKNYIIPFTSPYRFSIFSAFKFLKTKINLTKKSYKRIFIIRKNEKKNKSLKNIEEVKKILIPYGFSFISFEDYSFLDQIKIMHSCKILLGLHGAGFTNMVFMQPGCSVIDILPFYYSIPRTKEFQVSAEMIGLNYFEIYTKKNINSYTKFEIELNNLIGVIEKVLNNENIQH